MARPHKRLLVNYYTWRDVDDGIIEVLIDGKWVTKIYEINLSQNIPDSECCRVRIDGKYYYFG